MTLVEVTLSGEPAVVSAGTLQIDDVLEERTVASMVLLDDVGELEPRRGDPIHVVGPGGTVTDGGVAATDDGVAVSTGGAVLFRGFIEDPETSRVGTGPTLQHAVSAIDGHYLADKRLAAVAYEGESVEAIVEDLHARYLADEGVVLGAVDVGPTVELIVFNWVSVAAALSELAEASGYWWYIASTDAGFTLEFRKRDAFAAPFPVSGGGILTGATVVRAAPDYRNVQYIRGVRDVTDPQTETFAGDGETRTFTVGFRIAQVPTVELNSAAQTVGIRGVDEGRDFYWNKDDRTLTQDAAGTKLTGTDVLEVTYVGMFDAIVRSDDEDAISDRQTAEGGTGKVEHVAESRGLEGRTAAFSLAAAKLEKYGQIGKTVRFDTRLEGLRAGMLLPLSIADLKVDGELLISSVSVSDYAGAELRHRVTAVEGPHEQSWSRFFARLHDTPGGLVFLDNIAEVEVLTLLFPFTKEWEETDDQPGNFWFEVWPANDLATSATLFPQIDRDHWMLYVEWWDATSPLGRKQVTSRTLLDDQIVSTFYLSPHEANTAVDHVRFYGGIGATPDLESGDLAATEPVGESKSAAEAWQIVRTDTRAATPAEWWVIGDGPA